MTAHVPSDRALENLHRAIEAVRTWVNPATLGEGYADPKVCWEAIERARRVVEAWDRCITKHKLLAAAAKRIGSCRR